MANLKSAIKRIRQNTKQTKRNSYWRKTLRTSVRSVESAIKAGDVEAAQSRLPAAIGMINRAASKGVIPKTRASRRVSRLTTAVNKLDAQQ